MIKNHNKTFVILGAISLEMCISVTQLDIFPAQC